MSARGERGRERRERERETESGGVITHSGPYTIPLCSLYRFCREQGPPHACLYIYIYICIGSSISIAPCSCATLRMYIYHPVVRWRLHNIPERQRVPEKGEERVERERETSDVYRHCLRAVY